MPFDPIGIATALQTMENQRRYADEQAKQRYLQWLQEEQLRQQQEQNEWLRQFQERQLATQFISPEAVAALFNRPQATTPPAPKLTLNAEVPGALLQPKLEQPPIEPPQAPEQPAGPDIAKAFPQGLPWNMLPTVKDILTPKEPEPMVPIGKDLEDYFNLSPGTRLPVSQAKTLSDIWMASGRGYQAFAGGKLSEAKVETEKHKWPVLDSQVLINQAEAALKLEQAGLAKTQANEIAATLPGKLKLQDAQFDEIVSRARANNITSDQKEALFPIVRQQYEAKLEQALLDKGLKGEELARAKATFQTYVDSAAQDLVNKIASGKLIEAQTGETVARTKESEARTAKILKELQWFDKQAAADLELKLAQKGLTEAERDKVYSDMNDARERTKAYVTVALSEADLNKWQVKKGQELLQPTIDKIIAETANINADTATDEATRQAQVEFLKAQVQGLLAGAKLDEATTKKILDMLPWDIGLIQAKTTTEKETARKTAAEADLAQINAELAKTYGADEYKANIALKVAQEAVARSGIQVDQATIANLNARTKQILDMLPYDQLLSQANYNQIVALTKSITDENARKNAIQGLIENTMMAQLNNLRIAGAIKQEEYDRMMATKDQWLSGFAAEVAQKWANVGKTQAEIDAARPIRLDELMPSLDIPEPLASITVSRSAFEKNPDIYMNLVLGGVVTAKDARAAGIKIPSTTPDDKLISMDNINEWGQAILTGEQIETEGLKQEELQETIKLAKDTYDANVKTVKQRLQNLIDESKRINAELKRLESLAPLEKQAKQEEIKNLQARRSQIYNDIAQGNQYIKESNARIKQIEQNTKVLAERVIQMKKAGQLPQGMSEKDLVNAVLRLYSADASAAAQAIPPKLLDPIEWLNSKGSALMKQIQTLPSSTSNAGKTSSTTPAKTGGDPVEQFINDSLNDPAVGSYENLLRMLDALPPEGRKQLETDTGKTINELKAIIKAKMTIKKVSSVLFPGKGGVAYA